MSGDNVVCTVCWKPLQMNVLAIGDRLFHSSCLKCNDCKKPMTELETCFDMGPKLVCKQCFQSKHLPKCAGCEKTIDGKFLELNKKQFHDKCFPVCDQCKKVPNDRQYAKDKGKNVCLDCFWISVRDERRKVIQAKGASPASVTSPASAVTPKSIFGLFG